MSVRTSIILLNAVALAGIVGFIAFRILSLRRNPDEAAPQNLTTMYADDVLEGPKLERVLGLALVMLVIGVLVMVVYFLYEPFRSESMAEAFDERSVHRGAVLFASEASEDYNSTVSLLCADCHGVDGNGGSARWVVASEDPSCESGEAVTEELARAKPQCLPSEVAWAAPSLQLAPLRYSREQLIEIITYGRPGTPMPAWGVLSGRGALNEQSVEDLVNYIDSIKTTSQKAQQQAAKAVRDVRTNAAEEVATKTEALAEARDALAKLPAAAPVANRQRAQAAVTAAESALDAVVQWNRQMQSAGDGQILFQTNCARCHTRGWSYFDPANPTDNPMPEAMGGGAYGPNLRDGAVDNQFPPPNGEAALYEWIANGKPANEGYGIRGISSGRMPHFASVLTKEQIEAIMAYERSL